MAGIGDLFGGSETKSRNRPVPFPRLPAVSTGISTGRSSIGSNLGYARGTPGPDPLESIDINLDIDPEIQRIRDEALGGLSLLGDMASEDLDRIRGATNPFIEARVAPLIGERERARRGAERRGVSGPLVSLATNPFQGRISEERAVATMEAEQLVGQTRNFMRQIVQDKSGIAAQMLQQELAALGLSQQQVATIIQSQLEPVLATETRSETDGYPNIVGGLIGPGTGLVPSILGGIGRVRQGNQQGAG